jgi:hypothetical protein
MPCVGKETAKHPERLFGRHPKTEHRMRRDAPEPKLTERTCGKVCHRLEPVPRPLMLLVILPRGAP